MADVRGDLVIDNWVIPRQQIDGGCGIGTLSVSEGRQEPFPAISPRELLPAYIVPSVHIFGKEFIYGHKHEGWS